MNLDKLTLFLKKAKRNTYALESVKKVVSQRPKSKDYEYKEGEFIYHDTYFGGVCFIGEEIVYEKEKPIWGMNYNGFVVDDSITEEEIDKSLRGALKQEYVDIIPVRGPKEFSVGEYKYTNKLIGGLDRFEGREEVTKSGKLIYYALFHGGLIK